MMDFLMGQKKMMLFKSFDSMCVKTYIFKNLKLKITGGHNTSIDVSRSSISLATIIPPLKGMRVLDVGCGSGYMSIGALCMGAQHVTATDIVNMEYIIRKNLALNKLSQKRLKFEKGNLFTAIAPRKKFDVIIANLPQHALPATPSARKLEGKYGGFDGTDLVCQGLTEGAYYLRSHGKYFGSISELTNFQRTLTLAHTLYYIRIRKVIEKELESKETHPHITQKALVCHLQNLRNAGLIRYRVNHGKIIYRVLRCEFVLKK